MNAKFLNEYHRQVIRLVCVLVYLAKLAVNPAGYAQDQAPTVGALAKISDLVIPGSELEVIPVTDRLQPVFVRIVATYPHGDAFRYDIEYQGMEAGEFDLLRFLRRKDGSSLEGAAPVRVTIRSQLPPGQILPHAVEFQWWPRLGGYRWWATVAAAAWLVLLAYLIFSLRRPRQAVESVAAPQSFAELLQSRLEAAARGELQADQYAELERMILAYWKRRLGLARLSAAEAIRQIRQHPDAGPLLEQLEGSLHQPVGDRQIDIAKLVEPYRELAAADVEKRT